MNTRFYKKILMLFAASSLAGCFGSNVPQDIPESYDLVELCKKPNFAANRTEESAIALKTICPCVTGKADQIGDATFKDIVQKALTHADENGAGFGFMIVNLVNQTDPSSAAYQMQIANLQALSSAANECRVQY